MPMWPSYKYICIKATYMYTIPLHFLFIFSNLYTFELYESLTELYKYTYTYIYIYIKTIYI